MKVLGRICHAIHWRPKPNNKCKKYYDENKESSYVKYGDVNNLYKWAVSQKLPVNGFKWDDDVS